MHNCRRYHGRCGRVCALSLALALAVGLLAVDDGRAAQATYPESAWDTIAVPESVGWSTARLQRALEYADSIGSEAILIIQDGAVLVDWGETTRRFKVMSIRKSILSALIGVQVAIGTLDVQSTLAELGIDDVDPGLTSEEKRARVLDLMTARSGVYHPAAYETPGMVKRRPARGSHAPGAFWFYNNWDFNALGTILEGAAGMTVFEAFQAQLAGPLAMEDFRIEEDTERVRGPESEHVAYLFRLSARDLARLGLLFLREGRWGDAEILSRGWVAESTQPHVDNGMFGGYGYMWWAALNGEHYPLVRMPDGTFSARGTGEQNLVIIPAFDLVIVHLTDVDRPSGRTHVTDFGRLLQRILAARAEDAPS
ncbi:MAG: serine hydrolase [Gemmatimonadota bacterium]